MTSLERKQKSEEFLLSLGIILLDDLPPIEEEKLVILRSSQEVAERILILSYLNCAASDPDLRPQLIEFLVREGLWDKTSDVEKVLFQKNSVTEDELTVMLWRTESIWRVRTVGEQLYAQFGVGLARMARTIKERMNVRDNEDFKPVDLINARTLSSCFG